MVLDRMLLAAIVVGLIAGVAYSAIQHLQVIPLIQLAERYENHQVGTADQSPASHTVNAQGGDHEHSESVWAPADGIERSTYTALTNTLTAVGLAVVLVALMVGTQARTRLSAMTWRDGLLWGAAGYAVFFIAPSIGVLPGIPGQAAAPLEDRQFWWVLTVACSAMALLGVTFLKSPWRWVALVLLVVPHLVGAPHLDPGDPLFPTQEAAGAAELTKVLNSYIGATALANAVLWLVLGLTSVWAIQRYVVAVDVQQ